ncbi:MAG TPA: glycosyltransferase, partial [Thermoleophilia bacterium]|nr:glycosyltransferase [Thermoleophilia bacterium]
RQDELISLLYAGSDAVLANSGHEPFGLVGLEVMAVGGLAFVGSTGEDYAVPYLNAVVLDSDDPMEISVALEYLRMHPEVAERIRAEAQQTARSFSWSTIIEDTLLGKLKYVTLRQDVRAPSQAPASQAPPSPPRGGGAGEAAGAGGYAYGGESVEGGASSRRARAPRFPKV